MLIESPSHGLSVVHYSAVYNCTVTVCMSGRYGQRHWHHVTACQQMTLLPTPTFQPADRLQMKVAV